jgi:hypothetical protein
MGSIDWPTYMIGKMAGLRKCLMKEDEKSIPQAKLRMKRFVIYILKQLCYD